MLLRLYQDQYHDKHHGITLPYWQKSQNETDSFATLFAKSILVWASLDMMMPSAIFPSSNEAVWFV